MGSSSSKGTSFRSASSSSWSNPGGYSQSDYGQDYQNYPAEHPYPSYAPTPPPPQYQGYAPPPPQNHPPSQDYGDNRRRLDRRYSRIADDYRSLDEVLLLKISKQVFFSCFSWLPPLDSILYMLWVFNI